MLLDDIIREARERKEARVAAFPDDADLRPTVVIERSGRRVVTIESPTMDKEAGLFDAHIKLMKPGEEMPAPGELQRLCDEEGACDLDLISDVIVVQRLHRDGSA